VEKTFYDMDRAGVKELAEVWKPGVPAEKNEEYIARARELNRELEAALLLRYKDVKRKGTHTEVPDETDI
jgi:CPA2 family monovalent cation:H+ antiporter-2